MNVEPLSIVLWTRNSPPMAIARSLLMARPSPVPSCLLVSERPTWTNGWKIGVYLGLGNADAGVVHTELEAVATLLAVDRNRAARRRELHGVVEEVEEDLFDLGVISSHERVRERRLLEAKIFCNSLRLDHRYHGVHYGLQRHGADLDGQPARFDPTEVQDVVDDAEQVLLAAADALEVLSLLVRDLAANASEEKIGVAANRIERRPSVHGSWQPGMTP